MKLLVQPDDGARPLIKAIAGARRSIEIAIFRFDQREIEKALANAVSRGVAVQALIAHTNRAGEANLRRLERRLLAAGVTVARTADDLVRYHGKLMIVDRRELYLMAFNMTYLDMERSRSFGIVTRRPATVREAVRLFEADSLRTPYDPASDNLVVSPVNSRKLLAGFIEGAKKELFIYDPKISDRGMIRLLEERAAAGVDIRIIGRLTRTIAGIEARELSQMRLHTRSMIRDGQWAFIGSQSLRALELDERREVGLIFHERKLVAKLRLAFTGDWDHAAPAGTQEDRPPAAKVAKRVAKLLLKELPPVTEVLDGAVKDVELNPEEVEAVVKDAVKSAVKEAVSDMVEQAVEESGAHR